MRCRLPIWPTSFLAIILEWQFSIRPCRPLAKWRKRTAGIVFTSTNLRINVKSRPGNALLESLLAILPKDVKHGPLRDEHYVCPSESWAREFNEWCVANVPAWRENGGDCDNRSDWVRIKANESCRKAGIDTLDVAIANLDIVVPPWSQFLNLNPERIASHETNLICLDDDTWHVMDAAVLGLFPLADVLADPDNCLITWFRL